MTPEAFGRVRKIYVTDTRRTQQTARGSGAAARTSNPWWWTRRRRSGELARRVLRENRGGLALVVGHSNTVPQLVAELAARDKVPPIGEEEFDTLYVVTVPTIGRASVLRMKY